MMAIWTPKDDERLWKMVNEQKLKYATIADLLERTSDSIRNRVFTLRKLHGNDWLSEERVAFFDIESNHLKANIGEMMSWALKPMDGEVIYSGWTRQEAIDWDRLDRRLMRELLKELQNVDLLVTYYGTGFDNKFIRTRAMVLGIPGFPKFGQLKHFDLYYAVKGRMALHSNRLASATEALGIVETGSAWLSRRHGLCKGAQHRGCTHPGRLVQGTFTICKCAT
jgi:uncharacterized protein YprB with RNaseH-like and TPR domain